MVQMNDVKMVYGNTEAAALNGISFTINEGEFVFLVGPSGSGKTTIIKLITGELSPTSGQITVNGFDMQGMCSSWSAWPTGKSASRRSFPAASSSAWPSPARS